MKITIERTEAFFMLGDVLVRGWEGVDENGDPVVALVSMVYAREGSATPAERGLISIPPPDAETQRMWAAEVLSRRPPSPESLFVEQTATGLQFRYRPGEGLLMTAFPPGAGPYERWELTDEATGEVLAAGGMPFDDAIARAACDAYFARQRNRTGDH